MKQSIYISTDIEGVAWTSDWDEGDDECRIYQVFRTIMSVELATLAESVIKPSRIVLRDAHGSGKNVLKSFLPKYVRLIRGWNKEATNMMRGIDYKKYDFACLHGYHAAGNSGLSPLAHTFSSDSFKAFTLNGKLVGETTFAIYTAAYFGVPMIYVCGDYGAVTEAQSINPHIVGTMTKKFTGRDKFMHSEKEVLDKIKTDFAYAQAMFYKNKEKFNIKLPEKFVLTLTYTDKIQAKLHAARVPGVKQIAPDTLEYQTDDYMDLLTTMRLMKLYIQQ